MLYLVIQGIYISNYLVLFQPKIMIMIYYKFKEIEIIYQVIDYSLFLDYAGFVPGIKAENLFGKTFGKITLLSSTK